MFQVELPFFTELERVMNIIGAAAAKLKKRLDMIDSPMFGRTLSQFIRVAISLNLYWKRNTFEFATLLLLSHSCVPCINQNQNLHA